MPPAGVLKEDWNLLEAKLDLCKAPTLPPADSAVQSGMLWFHILMVLLIKLKKVFLLKKKLLNAGLPNAKYRKIHPFLKTILELKCGFNQILKLKIIAHYWKG